MSWEVSPYNGSSPSLPPQTGPVLELVYSIHFLNLRKIDQIAVFQCKYLRKQGRYGVTWNADQHSSGVYMIKMTTGSTVKVQKVMLLK